MVLGRARSRRSRPWPGITRTPKPIRSPTPTTPLCASTRSRAARTAVGYLRAVLIDSAAAADYQQAQYLIRTLSNERADLAQKLASHARILNDVRTARRSGAVSHHRWCIRRLEAEMQGVNRMIDALRRRFPEQAG